MYTAHAHLPSLVTKQTACHIICHGIQEHVCVCVCVSGIQSQAEEHRAGGGCEGAAARCFVYHLQGWHACCLLQPIFPIDSGTPAAGMTPWYFVALFLDSCA